MLGCETRHSPVLQARRAASIAAMSIFCIVIIASNARLAAAGLGSDIAAMSARGVICHDSGAAEFAILESVSDKTMLKRLAPERLYGFAAAPSV